MKILKVKDCKDGTTVLDCEFTSEEIQRLVQYAIVDIIRKMIKEYEKNKKVKKYDY